MSNPGKVPLRATKTARKELSTMLKSLGSKDSLDACFGVGMFRARKRLADGTIVTFTVTEPNHFRRTR